MANAIGYRWLMERYGVTLVQPLPVESEIGTVRRTVARDGVAREVYPANMRPNDTLGGHLTFALKHEGVNLELLVRLFHRISSEDLATWIRSEPSGQYARRTGFLAEWLTGQLLPVEQVVVGNYIPALDPERYLVSTAPTNNARWRVRDNLPGTREFCPIVRRTDTTLAAEQLDCLARLEALQADFGMDILMRSAVWLTTKESRASFQIEHEADQEDRVRRFAAVMQSQVGAAEDPLSPAFLTRLQQEIIGARTTLQQFGLRRSPVFVGSVTNYRETVDYIAPPWETVAGILGGLSTFLATTRGASPVVRAAVTAFGFIYLHPLADGNGRVHRFLINDILRRDGAVPPPYVLPVSATITNSASHRGQYETVLEQFSKPLMAATADRYAFTRDAMVYDDGIQSNFTCTAYGDLLPAWRYPDLTAHVDYMARLIETTIETEMRQEAVLLRSWDRARDGVKAVIDGPNGDIDRIIRSVQDNHGAISNKLRKDFPPLQDASTAERIIAAVGHAFGDADPEANNDEEGEAAAPAAALPRA